MRVYCNNLHADVFSTIRDVVTFWYSVNNCVNDQIRVYFGKGTKLIIQSSKSLVISDDNIMFVFCYRNVSDNIIDHWILSF